VDGKDGVTFNKHANRHPKIKVLWERSELWSLTADLVAEIARRNTYQRKAGIEKLTRDFIAVVIDEMAAYTASPSVDSKHPDIKVHKAFTDNLVTLAQRGRSAGVRLILSAQRPIVEHLHPSVRAQCATTIAFKLQADADATSVFGTLDNLPADPRKLTQGRALISYGLTGQLQAVQFPLIQSRGAR
jgi:DNA segregation ATPase FtsK/SpoIIIE-like protein